MELVGIGHEVNKNSQLLRVATAELWVSGQNLVLHFYPAEAGFLEHRDVLLDENSVLGDDVVDLLRASRVGTGEVAFKLLNGIASGRFFLLGMVLHEGGGSQGFVENVRDRARGYDADFHSCLSRQL